MTAESALPPLPTCRSEGRIASIRESLGRLFLDYRLNGRRQRVYLKLADTPSNREHLKRVAHQVERTLEANGDVLALLSNVGLVETVASTTSSLPIVPIVPAAPLVTASPLFSAFAEQWFTEFKVGWRRTYVTTVRGIIDRHLLPRFGPLAMGSITRAAILEMRSQLSIERGRRPGSRLSPARINTVMLILRQILQEAADRYEFSRCRWRGSSP